MTAKEKVPSQNPQAVSQTPALVPKYVRADTTLRWPCRGGDLLLWIRSGDPFSGGQARIPDFWQMRDGNHVTITNRWEDLPSWFRLFPPEVCGRFVSRMMEKVRTKDFPEHPVDGPNLWRIRTGDSLVWIGKNRPGYPSESGILEVLRFSTCCLIVGEGGDNNSMKAFASYGAPSTNEMDPVDVIRCQAALEIVRSLGAPRKSCRSWQLGC